MSPTQVLGYLAAIGGVILIFYIAYQAKQSGENKIKEAQEHEALDNVFAGKAIEDKYRNDPDYREKANTRFDSGKGK